MKRLGILFIVLFSGPAVATAPDVSLRPIARVEVRTEMRADIHTSSLRTSIRPQMRPTTVIVQPTRAAAQSTQPVTLTGVATSVRPLVRPLIRPGKGEQKPVSKRRARRKGAVCGNLEIKGEEIGRIPGKLNGCGLSDAVRVTSIAGVRLSRPSTMDCNTAKALNKWVEKAVIPAFRRRGKVVELRVAAHYSCRTRNNKPGARISEHGRGKAIDISGFTMKDGKVITVVGDWGKGKPGNALAEVHKKACGPFGTVLGPKADRYHQDHFHLDTASYRGGPYCR